MQVKKKPKKTAKAVPEKSRKKKEEQKNRAVRVSVLSCSFNMKIIFKFILTIKFFALK